MLAGLPVKERRLQLAKSQRIPNVDLQAGADLNAPPDFNVGPKGQIAMQLPLFYREQGEISLAKARLELLRLTADSQRTNVAAQVTAAYYDFNAKAHQAEQFRNRMVPETVKLEEMARESYQAGKSNLSSSRVRWPTAQMSSSGTNQLRQSTPAKSGPFTN